MAAAGIYTIGGSFWEFGQPDWELTKMFMIFGVAEDHDSNPLKLGLGRLKERGVKVVAVNPVRTGYSAIADEWVPVTPGTDGLFILALVHELLRSGAVDVDYLLRYTNAAWLVVQNEYLNSVTPCFILKRQAPHSQAVTFLLPLLVSSATVELLKKLANKLIQQV